MRRHLRPFCHRFSWRPWLGLLAPCPSCLSSTVNEISNYRSFLFRFNRCRRTRQCHSSLVSLELQKFTGIKDVQENVSFDCSFILHPQCLLNPSSPYSCRGGSSRRESLPNQKLPVILNRKRKSETNIEVWFLPDNLMQFNSSTTFLFRITRMMWREWEWNSQPIMSPIGRTLWGARHLPQPAAATCQQSQSKFVLPMFLFKYVHV